LIAGDDNRTDHLVSGHERIDGQSPSIVEHRKIRVADAAMADLDFHLVRAQRAGIKLERFQWLAFGGRSVGF
jgi:hypothetical protein